MDSIVETDLGISGQALAVLALLSRREPNFAEYNHESHDYNYQVRTSAWYNGRERGISLLVSRGYVRECLVITFGEHRNSDHIFVDSWVSPEGFLNPPTVSDFPDEAYQSRTFVEYGRIDKAVDVIIEKMTAYFAAAPAEVPPPPVVEEPVSHGPPARILDLEEEDESEPERLPIPSRIDDYNVTADLEQKARWLARGVSADLLRPKNST